jgi:hypothetical protein
MNIYCKENLIWLDWYPSGSLTTENTEFDCPLGFRKYYLIIFRKMVLSWNNLFGHWRKF